MTEAQAQARDRREHVTRVTQSPRECPVKSRMVDDLLKSVEEKGSGDALKQGEPGKT